MKIYIVIELIELPCNCHAHYDYKLNSVHLSLNDAEKEAKKLDEYKIEKYDLQIGNSEDPIELRVSNLEELVREINYRHDNEDTYTMERNE